VSDRDAARMFSMNARTWRRQPFIQRNYSACELDCLEHDLAELAAENSSASSIEFGRRRLVLERTDSERNKPHDRTLD
jgi:hypothetical protein